ncbi:MAG: hypothetical protein WCY11_06085 [Novosphingobium sp.]
MPISLLFGCCQIETCTPDLAATRDYLVGLLGAIPVEQELARQIAALLPGTGYAVDHLECGGAVFQINQPARGMTFAGQKSIHEAYLASGGPCVTNLNFYVDDIVHARDLLIDLGAPVHIAGPSTAVRALTDYGPDNTRPGGEDRPFLFMGTRHLIGFDLEIMEPNFLRLHDQAAQFPAYVEPRPADSAGLLLHRLVAVVPDLGGVLQAITRIFAPASRSKPYCLRQGPDGRSFRIGLGGLEIEYCQPMDEAGSLARHLREHGPGIAAAVFGCADSQPRCAPDPRWRPLAPDADQASEGLAGPLTRFHASSRRLTGFDIVIEPAEPRP